MSRHYNKNKTALIAIEAIASRIVILRGHRVMLDSDLAALYGVTTKRLNEQVARNHQRFPVDFAFQLTEQEFTDLISQFSTSIESTSKRLRSQNATSKPGRGGRRYHPWA